MNPFWIEKAWAILLDIFHLSRELLTYVFWVERVNVSVLCSVTKRRMLRHFHQLWIHDFFSIAHEIPGLSWQTEYTKITEGNRIPLVPEVIDIFSQSYVCMICLCFVGSVSPSCIFFSISYQKCCCCFYISPSNIIQVPPRIL